VEREGREGEGRIMMGGMGGRGSWNRATARLRPALMSILLTDPSNTL